MQKRTENEQLGKPIHPNIPPTRPTNHTTTGNEPNPLYELAQLRQNRDDSTHPDTTPTGTSQVYTYR